MPPRLVALLEDLSRAASLAGPELARAMRHANWLAEATGGELDEFLAALLALPMPLAEPADRLLAQALAAVVRERRKAPTTGEQQVAVELIDRLYRQLGRGSPARAQLLAWLAAGSSPGELAALVGLLVADPPERDEDVVQAMGPLFRRDLAVDALFPRLLDALASTQLAAPVLDLANFVAREKLVPQHPAAGRSAELVNLLGEISQSLARLEESPAEAGLSPAELSRLVERSVALAVSLCDTLAQIGALAAIGKLNQTLKLRHRRLRTEAAAALVKLGDDDGATELIRLADEPVARLRVLAYAKELGLLDKIDPALQSPQAWAEAELVVWLAEPTQFGVPPARLELFDHRRQFWPGYTQPLDCWLFRFTYAITVGDSERSFSNIGIAGPLAHAFTADLGDLSPDDIYAAYAGWQAEHEEIKEFDVGRLSKSEKIEVERLVRRLHDAGYTQIEPQLMGYFFGDKALVATAARDGLAGVAVADFQEIAFFPHRHSQRPLGPRECYCIHKGRKLLKSFNR